MTSTAATTELFISNTCRCGTKKLPQLPGGNIGYCPNCDRTQASERREGGRVPTHADRRYHLAWEKLKREIYKRRG